MEPLNISIVGLGLDTVIYSDGAETLGDAIVREAARRLIKDAESNSLKSGLTARVHQIRDDEIRALVKVELAQAMTADIRETNGWGEPTGPATTLRALILKHAADFFTKKMSPDSYNRTPAATRAEAVVQELVAKELSAELAAAFKEEKVKVVAAVRAKAAEVLADAVKRGVGL